ncbi:MAG: sugar transferase, partial [Bacteroidota bacterium]|nr:sugar transferase [Bacteroidota bacterium]
MSVTNNSESAKTDLINILYVGTDKDSIQHFSEDPGFKINVVDNGFHAIRWLEENDLPDTIFSEIFMPGMNGYALHTEILDKVRYQTVPFIIHGRGIDDNERLKSYNLGLDDIYQRPLDLEKIIVRLKFLIPFKKSQSVISVVESKQKIIQIPFIKRLFDIVFSLGVLICISPLLLVIALAIRIESKGKVFYAAKRVGAGYKIFPFFKFRSMYTGADAQL